MRKHNQIHTLGAAHDKTQFCFLRKSKDFKCSLWSVFCVMLVSISHLFINKQT